MATNPPRLIDLAQIQGGLALKAVVDAWNIAYPASKVTTEILKDALDPDAGKYTAEELLIILKTTVEDQLGTGSTSVDARIAAAKTAALDATALVQTNLDALEAKKIKDRMKLTAVIDHDGTVVIDDPVNRLTTEYLNELAAGLHDNETLGVENLDTTQAYNLYYEDNTPVRNATGGNVTFTFTKTLRQDGVGTGPASSAPYKRDTKIINHTYLPTPYTITDSRNIVLPHTNISPGSFTMTHSHSHIAGWQYHDETKKDYIVGVNYSTAAHPVDQIHTFEHDQKTIDYLAHLHDVHDNANVIVDVTGDISHKYYFNGLSGRVVFDEASITDTVTISYDYRSTEVKFVQTTDDNVPIKLFPVGTWNLNQLPESYLLDNTESNLVAYGQAIDKLVVDMAEDQQLIDYVIQLIAQESVQQALLVRTEELRALIEQRRQELIQLVSDKEVDSYNRDVDLENDIRDTNYKVDQLKALYAADEHFDELTLEADGDVALVLKKIPSDDVVELYINGTRYREGKHFTVDRFRTVGQGDPVVYFNYPTIYWTFTAAAGGFDLLKAYDYEARYDLRVAKIAEPAATPYFTEATVDAAQQAWVTAKANWNAAYATAVAGGTTLPAPLVKHPRQYVGDYSYDATGTVTDSKYLTRKE